MIAKIEMLLGLDIDDVNAISTLNTIMEMYTSAINLRAGTESVPTELEFVLIECTIARYNKLGSEGLKSESVDILSFTYHDEILTQYIPYLDAYKLNNNVSTKEKVRFL